SGGKGVVIAALRDHGGDIPTWMFTVVVEGFIEAGMSVHPCSTGIHATPGASSRSAKNVLRGAPLWATEVGTGR
ncbi:MAG TPA: hypothetical protein VJY65_08605, partial [Chloroflexota bacterium]|nr:hypothetical protein [Chloroflexota bacterium]